MSSPQSPEQGRPSGYPGAWPPAERDRRAAGMSSRPRPGLKGVWFGVAAMVAAVAVPAVVLLVLVVPQVRGDAQYVAADGAAHSLTVPGGTRMGLYTTERTGPIPCRVASADGAQLVIVWINGEVTVNQWTATRSFDSGDGRIVVTCAETRIGAEDQVRVDQLPNVVVMVGGILGAIAFGILFMSIGTVLVVVTLVRRSRIA
jgi:ferric-dicitrate binding protein FerR (iron transport regulator)